MKIQIARVDETMITALDLEDIKGTNEISHVIAELEVIKLKLLKLWEKNV